jgi:tryptophan halogenase
MSLIKNFKKIVIVGGGSAGWMSAALIIKLFPNLDISVIESPDFPTVGVGESTLQSIKEYCALLEIDEKDFMSFTDASYKLSIKFTDFSEINDGGFHYPFGMPCFEGNINGFEDWFYKKALYPNTPNDDFIRSYYSSSALFETNKFTKNLNNKFPNYDPVHSAAYHFDATKFGLWLKDRYCVPRGVKIIPSTVDQVFVNDSGVEKLQLSNGNTISADLYIDCTGWKSLLLGETLKEPFISYSNMLPNNRAWATRIPYKDKDRELEPFTNCTALANGWVWNIPIWSRLGTGYVYSDKFIDPENALEQFKQHLISDKMVCSRTREEIDSLEFKDISMRIGIHRRTFVKNVVAIGLSAGFIEPLESNGLFSVHHFLEKLCKTMLSGTITQWDKDAYNTAVRGMFQNFAEFVALHYATSHRNDSDYWIANGERVYDPTMPDLNPTSSVGFFDFQDKKMFTGKLDLYTGITFISTGMNRHIVDKIDTLKRQFHSQHDFRKTYFDSFTKMDMRKKRWQELAEKELTLCQYLKKYIHVTD